MASVLIERLLTQETPYIQTIAFTAMIGLYSSEMVTASDIKTAFDLDTDSGNELDTLLATLPAINLLNLTLTNVANRCRWAFVIQSVLDAAIWGAKYNTAAEVRTALGI